MLSIYFITLAMLERRLILSSPRLLCITNVLAARCREFAVHYAAFSTCSLAKFKISLSRGASTREWLYTSRLTRRGQVSIPAMQPHAAFGSPDNMPRTSLNAVYFYKVMTYDYFGDCRLHDILYPFYARVSSQLCQNCNAAANLRRQLFRCAGGHYYMAIRHENENALNSILKIYLYFCRLRL